MGSVRDSIDDSETPVAASFEDLSDQEISERFNSRLNEVASSSDVANEPLTGEHIFNRQIQGRVCVWSLQSLNVDTCRSNPARLGVCQVWEDIRPVNSAT